MISKGDRAILSKLDNEDEEYFNDYLNKEGTVLSEPEGRFPCVYVKFDDFEQKEYVFVHNLDKI